MAEPIFLKNKDGKLVKLDETLYEKEEDLQIILAENPELIYSISDQIPSLLLVAKEAGIPGDDGTRDDFSLDHIFVDTDAKPTFIEVKRSTDTRIRREVIGQMFDYAAHARAYWTADKIQTIFRDTWTGRRQDPDQVLANFLGEEYDAGRFWEQFMTNLKGGNIRLIFAADTIPKRLQLIVEFLRDYMDPIEVRALEVRQFLGENELQMIAPHYVGGSVQADMRKDPAKKKERWTEEDFLSELAKNTSQEDVVIARRIKKWADETGITNDFGTGDELGSLFLEYWNGKKVLVSLTLNTDGNVRIDFRWMRTYPPFTDKNKRIELVRQLNAINGMQLSESGIEGYPIFPIRLLRSEEAFIQFTRVIQWVMEQYRSGYRE
jgi:hypothetical protein